MTAGLTPGPSPSRANGARSGEGGTATATATSSGPVRDHRACSSVLTRV
jgi:hypothetical protein